MPLAHPSYFIKIVNVFGETAYSTWYTMETLYRISNHERMLLSGRFGNAIDVVLVGIVLGLIYINDLLIQVWG